MTDETGAVAPVSEQAPIAPAATETTKPEAGIATGDAAPEQAETQENETEQGDQEDADKPKRRSTSDRYRRKISAQAGVIERLSSELDALKSKASSTEGVPKVTDYAQGEWDPAFIADTAAHKAAQKISNDLNEREQRTKTEQLNAAKSDAAEEFLERAETVRSRIPDFDQTFAQFAQGNGAFAPHVVEELHTNEHGPLLAYQLAKNPQLAAALNAMSPRDVAREIGRLESKVSLPQPKKQTQAPAPIAALKGGAAPATDLHRLAKSDDASAYIAARNAQEKARA